MYRDLLVSTKSAQAHQSQLTRFRNDSIYKLSAVIPSRCLADRTHRALGRRMGLPEMGQRSLDDEVRWLVLFLESCVLQAFK